MLPQLTVYAKIIYLLMVVISGALCTVEDYVIMSQCAHNKAIHLAAEGTVSVTDISQTQNITILGLPDFVNNAFKIALYAKETQRYLCFSENWRLVALKELQNTCYFNETIVHGYFVFRSVLDLQRRIGFTHRGKAVGPKKNVNDACYLFTKIQANEFFHQHNNYFAHKTTTAASSALATATTMMAKAVTLPSNRLKVQRNKNKRRNNNKNNNNNNNGSNDNQNLHKLNGHNSNISSNLSSNRQHEQQQQPQQEQLNDKLVLEQKVKQPHKKSHKHHHHHHDHQHHHHHQKHHLVRHHHNNPDVIARRQQHEQKQKRRPHNRLRMLEKATASTSTTTAYQSQTEKSATTSPTTLSKSTQADFTTSKKPNQKTITTPIMPKVTSNNGKLLPTILMATASSPSFTSSSSSSSSSLSSSSSSTHRTTTTPATSKRKGRRRNHRKHTHKQQKLNQQQMLKATQQPADDQQFFITEENEKAFSLSSLAETTWSDFTSIASFLDEATSYYGNEWSSTSSSSSLSSLSSDESLVVSPTAIESSSETSTRKDSIENDNELTSLYSSQSPLDESTKIAYTTINSIRNRKKSTTSSLSTPIDEGHTDEIESTLNEMFLDPGPTVAFPNEMKATTAHQTKVNFKQNDKAATTATTTSTTATNTSSNKNVSYAKSHVEPDTMNVTSMGETSTATTSISNVISKEAAHTFTASTTTQQQQQLHEVTPTLMSNTVIDVNIKKWLMNVKVNQSNENININNNKNILRNSMTEFINSNRSSHDYSSENGTFHKNQNGSLQQYQSKVQHTNQNVELNAKNPIATLLNNTTMTATLPTKRTILMPQDIGSTTLSPLLQLFSPYYITKSNNLFEIEHEKNINNGNINNSILEDKTTPIMSTTKSNAQKQYTNTIITQNSLSTTPMSISSTSTLTSTSMLPSLKKTIRKSTQKLLATPFHQLTTYVRNEAGDIDIDNIDNISVYPDIMESETFTDDIVPLKKHQHFGNNNNNNNSNNTNSRLIVVSGYLPTSASAVLPESIQMAKIKINNERQRLWPQRFVVGNAA